MARNSRSDPEISAVFAQLAAMGEGAPSLAQKLQIIQAVRSQSAEGGNLIDIHFLEELGRLRYGMMEASQNQEELRKILSRLTAPPWHPAVFLGSALIDADEKAMVAYGNTRRVVGCADQVDPDALVPGQEILLSNELNFIVSESPYSILQYGETAFFDRLTPDGRMVLKSRDEEFVVDVAGPLREETLKTGDQIRWDRNAWMAVEKIERSRGEEFYLEDTPSETFDRIGGLDRQIEELQRSIRLHYFNREVVLKYCLHRVGSVLLSGPPGTGKTMIARALANWLGQLSGTGRARFMNIKPGGLHSMWFGESERNIRKAFRVAREAGEEHPEIPVVMFFDEVDAIGGARGSYLMRVDDKVLTALMAELDGLQSRGNICVVAATNRKDSLDSALTRQGRLGDLIIEIPRPNMRAAREIFAKHLSEGIPYHSESLSHDPKGARREIIDATVSRIYSPNGESDLAEITFRDGKRRMVKAGEMMNGASIAKIARIAVERACVREVESGESGVRLGDMLAAVGEELACLSRALSPANCRNHLSDLPQDVDVVRVEPVKKKVNRVHRYLNVA